MLPQADDDWSRQGAGDRTDRLCFVVERDDCAGRGTYETQPPCHRQDGSRLPDSSQSTVVDAPMPSVGISTATVFLLDRRRTLHLIYSLSNSNCNELEVKTHVFKVRCFVIVIVA